MRMISSYRVRAWLWGYGEEIPLRVTEKFREPSSAAPCVSKAAFTEIFFVRDLVYASVSVLIYIKVLSMY